MSAQADPFSDARTIQGQRTSNQIGALFQKSLLVQKRQYKTNVCQLLFPLAMILLLWALQLFVNSVVRDQYGEYTPALEHPPLIPPYLMFWNSDPCPSSSDVSTRTDANLARYLMTDSGSGLMASTNLLSMFTLPSIGGLINGIYIAGAEKSFDRGSQPATKCLSNPVVGTAWNFQTESNMNAVDARLFKGWGKNDSFLGGLSLEEASSTRFRYNVLVNKSFTDLYDMPALTGSITNAVYRTLMSYNGTVSASTQLQLTGTKSFPMRKTKIGFDLISLIGPSIYIYLFSMLLPVFMHNLVSEKESNIRELMEMMGLKPSVHFLVTYLFNYVLYLVAICFLIAIACLLGFRYFLLNAFGSYFILLLIWGHVLCAAAFLLAMFFAKSKTATVVGYLLVFGLGLIASTLIRNFYQSSTTPASTMFLIQLVPNFALFRALDALRDGVSFGSTGLVMDELGQPDVAIVTVYIYLICEWVVILLLVYLLEKQGGPAALFKRVFGLFRHKTSIVAQCSLSDRGASVTVPMAGDEDAEGSDIVAQAAAALDESVPAAVRIRALRKVYKGYGSLHDKVAVKGLSMVIRFGECLGFLGSNGAGKTTTISMLCGYVAPTSGTAIMFGKDINEDMARIHTIMGICPQENVIWGELSGGEHLEFFGRLKGLKAIVNGLHDVELLNVRDKFAMQYSGGMKRRLCVAIAFIGNPSIVLLDEPTTGLDPAARRNLWSVISRYKKQCALMLTTHSMEEAENLCDRVGIFERGSLRVIGTSSELKQRFEKGYKLTLTTNEKHENEIGLFVHRIAPDAILLNKLGGVLTFEVPRAHSQLSVIFREMEAQKQPLGIIDWCIANTTLEEVFVRIATGKYKAVKENNDDVPLYRGIIQ